MLFMAVILSAQVRVTTTDRLFVREKAQIGTDTSKYFQTITDSISASSTHRQAPTAKAVYNLVSTSGGGGVSDGDKGDIDVASSGAVWTVDTGSITTVKIAANAVTVTEIANSAVTYAKMQDVSATDRLLGRDSGGSGSVEEISVGGGLEFSGSGSIRIAQQSATSGQVLKWNGTTWAPDDDATSAGATGHNIAENGTGVTQRDTLNFSDDQIDFTVSSTATSTDVSGKIAQGGATSGQVLKWNGSAWAPADDSTVSDGDKGDIDVTASGATWTVDTAAITAVKLNQMGASTGEYLRWTGSAWDPDSAKVVTDSYPIGGTGTASDPITFLPVGSTGQVFKWNGFFWAAGDDSNGIYSGSGTSNATVTTTGTFQIRDNDNDNVLSVGHGSPGYVDMYSQNAIGGYSEINMADGNTTIYVDTAASIKVRDYRGNAVGMEYYADYSNTLKANARSIPDVGTVRRIVSDSIAVAGDGNGIYDGNGNIPNGTISDLLGSYRIRTGSEYVMELRDTLSIFSNSDGAGSYGHILTLQDGSAHKATFYDANGKGLEYAADYSAGYTSRSLVDKGYVLGQISDSISIISGADGNGIYDGNGTVPASTTATLAGTLSFDNAASYTLNIGDVGAADAGVGIKVDASYARLGNVHGADNSYVISGAGGNYIRTDASNLQQTSSGTSWNILAGDFKFVDDRGTKKGIEYSADYSAGILANARSIPDVGIVQGLISDSLATVGGGISDGDKGDIDVTSSGAVWTVDTAAITDVKVSDVSVSKLTSGNLAAGLAATLPNTSTTARINYNNSNSALLIDDANNGTSVSSEDGTNYLYAANDEVSVVFSPIPGVNQTASGIKIYLTANENQAFGDLCYIDSDGEAHLGDADTITMSRITVMCLGSVSASGTGTYLVSGVARNDTWSLTVGAQVYLSTTGTTGNTITQTAPSGANDCVTVIGVATHANRILFNPSPLVIELN